MIENYRRTEKGKEACKRAEKKYSQTAAGKENHRKGNQRYRQTEGGKKNKQKADRKYRLSHPEKRKAHSIVSHAVITGKLTRPDNCESCFKECKPEAHHEDYSKPLEVDWLCTECHNKQGVKV